MFEWSGFGEKHLNFIKTPIAKHKKITILRGAIRCVVGDTKIFNVEKNKFEKIKDFKGGYILTYLDGKTFITKASKSFRKEKAEIYEVITDSRSIKVSTEHLFLTEKGYKNIKYLIDNKETKVFLYDDCPFACNPRQTNWGLSLLARLLNVRRWKQILQDLKCYYSTCFRQYGVQLREDLNIYLSAFQQLDDVHEHNPLNWQKDERGKKSVYIRFCQWYNLVCKRESSSHNMQGSLLRQLYTLILNQVFELCVLPILEYGLKLVQFLLRVCLLLSFLLKFQFHFLSIIVQPFYLLLVCNMILYPNISYHKEKIKSIKHIGEEYLYDIKVPFFSNYLSSGYVNHNSGKTTAMMTKWLEYLAYMPNHLKLIAGVSKDTVYDNVLSDMFEFWEHFGIRYNYNHSTGMLKVEIEPNVWSHCKIVGAEKAGSEKKIRGKTIAGAYIDELTLINYRFFKELLGRCSVQGAKIFCTTNPDSIDHWYNKEFGEDNPDVERISFTIDDNNTLPEDYKTFIKRQYKGAFYARMIEGLDVVAEGLVYDTFNPAKHTVSHAEILKKINNNEFKNYFVGIDYGWTDETAVTLFGATPDNTYYLIDELYKNHIDAEAIIEWIMEKQREYKKFIRFINSDSSRPEMSHKIRMATNILTYEDKPKLEDSIGIVREIINFDRLVVNKDRCPYFLAEIAVYRYPDEDERLKASVDPNQPIDKYNHAMDSSRYALFEYETRYKK